MIEVWYLVGNLLCKWKIWWEIEWGFGRHAYIFGECLNQMLGKKMDIALEVICFGWNIKQETGWKDSLIDLMRGLVKVEVKCKIRVCRRNSNMLKECFNLSQLPSPYEGLVF